MKIKVINLSWEELSEDLIRRETFEQSDTFRLLYERPFAVPYGEPFGALVGDYEFTNAPADVEVLERMGHIAARTFCPFLTAASPLLLGLQSFSELADVRELASVFETDGYTLWRSFRGKDDSRFVALTLPRILARHPYEFWSMPINESSFEEPGQDIPFAADMTTHDRFCWMNCAYALAGRLASAFARSGWCAEIRGHEGGGMVEGLPTAEFHRDDSDATFPVEVALDDRKGYELSSLGFLPLSRLKNTNSAVFFTDSTAQNINRGVSSEAREIDRIMSRLRYVLATSRICHYLMLLARDMFDSGRCASECQAVLNRWLQSYVTTDSNPSAEEKVRCPLQAARVELQEVAEQPGGWHANVWLRLWIVPIDFTEDLTIRVVLHIPRFPGGATS